MDADIQFKGPGRLSENPKKGYVDLLTSPISQRIVISVTQRTPQRKRKETNMTTNITLTTIETLKLRKAGWHVGWQDAEIWQEQHIDDETPARMPDYTRGEFIPENFLDETAKQMTSDEDAESQELWQAYLDHVESILDDAAVAAWNEWRDQHCDEDERLIVDE